MKLPLILFSLVFIFQSSYGQKGLSGLQIGAEYFGGKTLLHSPSMRFTIPDRPWGITVEAMVQTRGNQYWQQMYGYPRFGLQFTYKSFGNDPILGHAIGLVPQIDLPILRKGVGNCWFRFGFGADVITKPFDRVNNYNNNAIGSYINNMTYLGFLWESPLSARWALRLGGTLTHTSNGAVVMPNLGLNSVDWRIGIVYNTDPQAEKTDFAYKQLPLEKKIIFNLSYGLGSEQFKTPNGPSYPVYILAAFASRQFSRSSKLNLGLEWNYYPANAAFNQSIDIPREEVIPQFKPSRISMNLGHELMFGRVSFLVALFMYVDHPFEGDGWFGNKLGPTYYFFKPFEPGRRHNIFLAGRLKSHGFTADYVELSMGACF